MKTNRLITQGQMRVMLRMTWAFARYGNDLIKLDLITIHEMSICRGCGLWEILEEEISEIERRFFSRGSWGLPIKKSKKSRSQK